MPLLMARTTNKMHFRPIISMITSVMMSVQFCNNFTIKTIFRNLYLSTSYCISNFITCNISFWKFISVLFDCFVSNLFSIRSFYIFYKVSSKFFSIFWIRVKSFFGNFIPNLFRFWMFSSIRFSIFNTTLSTRTPESSINPNFIRFGSIFFDSFSEELKCFRKFLSTFSTFFYHDKIKYSTKLGILQ